MVYNKNKTIEIFQQYFQDRSLFDSLNAYLDAKDCYLQEPVVDNRINLRLSYEYIYTDMKYFCSAGKINTQTFWNLVDILQEGLHDL